MPHWLVPVSRPNPHWKERKDKIYHAAGDAGGRLVGCWSRTDDEGGYAVVADIDAGDVDAFAQAAGVDRSEMREVKPV
jgi:hypothetical protein